MFFNKKKFGFNRIFGEKSEIWQKAGILGSWRGSMRLGKEAWDLAGMYY